MKKKTLWWIIGGVALIVLLIIIARSTGEEGIKIAVEQASAHTITETVTASGKIYPENEVKISPEVSGEITQLTIEEGDSVKKGDLLVKINPAIYSSMVNQAQASVQQSRAQVANSREMVAQAKAQYEQALANYNRNQKLYTEKVISALEFEQLESAYKTAKASYDAAKANVSGGQYAVEGASANLSQAQENYRKTTIIAPTSGIISSLNVKLGERVVGTAQMAGTDMLTIADLGKIEVRVDVSETDIAKVKLGDTTIVNADAYRDRTFTGIVSKIAVSSASSGSLATVSTDDVTNYTVHILLLPGSYQELLKDNGFPFKPGMSASVEIQTRRERNVLSIPVNAVTTREYEDSVKKKNEALGMDAIRQVVFVYDEKKKEVSLRDVKTGIQDNAYIQITEGLKSGEQVVIAPFGAIARTLKEKSKVIVVPKNKLFDAKEEKKP
ncbi:MAG TPA: efflux RND transporter periplasmic adaptor subunit [Flavipsychrobacter sp.]|nr:efflux RND transporter periplasmic adaptor subunit [Flavipsychrobacter sp.]